MVYADGSEPVYVGRLGLTDRAGRQLLVDWRTPAAEPFFAATHAAPSGLASRRRYRWTQGRVSDYWDEVFLPDDLLGQAALDDQSAFTPSLGASRTTRKRDVLSAIAGDQGRHHSGELPWRSGSRRRPGHRQDRRRPAPRGVPPLLRPAPRPPPGRSAGRRPAPPLAYIADVLPSLGEEGVQTCTVRDLVAEGASAAAETDPEVARLKSSADMVRAVEPAVGLYEEPPTERLTIATDWFDVKIRPADWAEAFGAPDPVTSHNLAREQVWQALLAIVADDHAELDVSADLLDRVLRQYEDLMDTLGRAWTLIDALTWWATCGRCPPTSDAARPGSPPTRYGSCNARTRRPGRPRTCRSTTPPGSDSAIPTRPGSSAGVRLPLPPPPSGRTWTASSTT